MYIEPNTRIIFLQDCPLDSSYENTIYFDDLTEQYNYFYSLKKHELSNQSYNRIKKGVSRVQLKAEDLYNCNYMMFQNSSFGNKWFYAFITNVEYVSNIVCEVYFTIDDLQTWFFDIELLECFVEREHSLTDNVGDNVITENVGLGEYVYSAFTDTGLFDEWNIVVASNVSPGGLDVSGGKYGGMYSGLTYYAFDNDAIGYDTVNSFIETVSSLNKQDGIVAFYMVPKFAVDGFSSELIRVQTITKAIPSKLGSYTPKNKKLLTYPYTFEYVTTFNGEHSEFRYEQFIGDVMQFSISGDVTPTSTFLCTPMNYMFNGGNFNEAVTLDKLPLCSYSTDAYKAWVAQNKSVLTQQTAMGVVGGATALIGGAISGNIGVAVGGGLTIASAVTNVMAQNEKAQAVSNPIHGTTSGVVEFALGVLDFHFTQMFVKEDFARTIDEYFNMFGYATKLVKKPNINSRPHWNYVQTIGCNIIGSCPGDAITNIKKIFDKGITFWKNGEEVGNYSLDNSPT